MFRMGGAAEGITSGLAPRQGYANNNAADQRVQQAPRTGMSDFLINFGLDLASRPPSGSIFSTAAAAAKDPFKQYQAGKVAREKMDWERGKHEAEMGIKRDVLAEQIRSGDLDRAQKLEIANIESKGKDEFKLEQINAYWDKKIEAAPPAEHADIEANRQKDVYDIVIHGADVSDKYKILSNQSATFMAQGLAEDAVAKMTNPATNKKWTKEDVGYEEFLLKIFKRYLRITSEFMEEEEKATGGRVGYQNAGAVGEGQNVLQGEGAAVQEETNEINISYEQLRERLPQEIGNEIVLLLSQSYEAFADFAEIQTQADVNEFNTKYNVQLFLPKQAGA